MAKWFLASAWFAAVALSANLNALMLPAAFCALSGFTWSLRNGR